jgi:hypothetical protein
VSKRFKGFIKNEARGIEHKALCVMKKKERNRQEK